MFLEPSGRIVGVQDIIRAAYGEEQWRIIAFHFSPKCHSAFKLRVFVIAVLCFG